MSGILDFKSFSYPIEMIGHKPPEKDLSFHIFDINTFTDKTSETNTPSFRQHFFDLTLFTETDFNYYYADREISMKPHMLQIVPPRQIQKIHISGEQKRNTKGLTIYFKPEFLSMAFDNARFIKDFPFFSYSSSNNIIDLSISESDELYNLMFKMHYEYEHPHTFTDQILNGYLWAFLHLVKHIWITNQKVTYALSEKSLLVSSFQDVLANNLNAITKISDYADMLNISTKHLSETIKLEVGVSAKQMANDLLLNECKSLLLHSTMSVSEIGYQLKFSDPSNFSKFFKRLSGHSPSSYRNQFQSFTLLSVVWIIISFSYFFIFNL